MKTFYNYVGRIGTDIIMVATYSAMPSLATLIGNGL
ncbi:hypothetical protein DICVIV_14043 [Dictyocaulus viviparus]|uniref:Uncharacterized protein n=1 Tax=Dictyocaulus viviparus TaxID=29172 RepID=A0A0D8XC39_DICVI|nr:hypothetical protein DICVIV_14046 [Dictyocaulus viviparus]KJH40044.1 hypothetical protein DICVIV_14043 [Dictyocaulus viviparus]